MFTVDPGSCHLKDFERAITIQNRAIFAGADAIKWQLFDQHSSPSNFALPYDWFKKLKEHGDKYGIKVYASVFDLKAISVLQDASSEYVKLAYSKRLNKELLQAIEKTKMKLIVTCDLFDIPAYLPEAIKLWTDADANGAKYPSYGLPCFKSMFEPHRFNGVSLHTMDPGVVVIANSSGAEYIEVHMRMGDELDFTCNDGMFAFTPEQIRAIIRVSKPSVIIKP